MAYENRLNWTDVEWAKHLGCPTYMAEAYRKIVNDIYMLSIKFDIKSYTYRIHIERNYKTANGTEKRMTVASSTAVFRTAPQALIYAWKNFIPSLELRQYGNPEYELPPRAIQLLNTNKETQRIR